MQIILLTYKKPLTEVDKYLSAHREFIQKMTASGLFLAAGPQIPRIGGVILAHAKDLQSLHEHLQQDPFYQYQIADCQIIEFIPAIMHEMVKVLLNTPQIALQTQT